MDAKGFTGLVGLAVAEGATSPNPGYKALIWSTTMGKPMQWNGSKWSSLLSSSGGTVTPMSADLALSSTSTLYQSVSATAFGLNIVEADATGLSVGMQRVFVNTGYVPIAIQNHAAAIIGWVLPGARVFAILEDNSTSAGVWRICAFDRLADNGLYFWGAPSALVDVSTSTATNTFTVMLSPQYGVTVYYDGTDMQCSGFKITDSGMLCGPITNLEAGTNNLQYPMDGCRLSGTEAFIAYNYAAGSGKYCRTLDLNTSTLVVTANSARQLDSNASGGGLTCDVISSSAVFVAWDSNGTSIKCCVVSVSAGACTQNSVATIKSLTTGGQSGYDRGPVCTLLTATLAHVAFMGSTNVWGNRVAISGTTCTPGTAISISTRGYVKGIVPASTTTSFMIYGDGADHDGPLYSSLMTDNGSAVSFGTEQTLKANSSSVPNGFSTMRFGFCVPYALGKGLIKAANGEEYSFFTVSAPGGVPTLSQALSKPMRWGGVRASDLMAGNRPYGQALLMTLPGYESMGTGTPSVKYRTSLQPVCLA